MMKDLYEDSPHEAYFAKKLRPTETGDDGTRELLPLDPYIISGGENTEQFYFKNVSKLTDYHFKVIPEYFGKESEYTVEFPIRIRNIVSQDSEVKIFCIFDLDTTIEDTSNQKKHENFVESIQDFINSGQVILCPSLPCFEYWLLLHFEDNTTLMKNNAAVANHLCKHMRSLFPNSNRSHFGRLRIFIQKIIARMRNHRRLVGFLYKCMNQISPNNKKKFSKMLKSRKYLDKMDWRSLICSNNKLEQAILRAKRNYNIAVANEKLDKQSYSLVYKAFFHKPAVGDVRTRGSNTSSE